LEVLDLCRKSTSALQELRHGVVYVLCQILQDVSEDPRHVQDLLDGKLDHLTTERLIEYLERVYEKIDEKMVPIKFPDNMVEVIGKWFDSTEKGCGVCLLCGDTISTTADFIPGTDTHDCPAGKLIRRDHILSR